MNAAQQRQANHAGWRRLRTATDRKYPTGRFIAIDGSVDGNGTVADDADFQKLVSALRASGRNPERVLIVRAGVELPENATIFANVSR